MPSTEPGHTPATRCPALPPVPAAQAAAASGVPDLLLAEDREPLTCRRRCEGAHGHHDGTDAEQTELEDFVKAGERTWNLERLWNLKAGLKAADDTLPKRLLSEAHQSGPAKGVVVHLDQMLPVYYRARGWDPNGVPTPEKLMELGLASV